MHHASVALLLVFLLVITNAAPTPLQSRLILRPSFHTQYQRLFLRQDGCNQAQCDRCRITADCTASTPAW